MLKVAVSVNGALKCVFCITSACNKPQYLGYLPSIFNAVELNELFG